MNDKSRVAALFLCFLMLFQSQVYAGTKTYSFTSMSQIDFDGTSGENSLNPGDVISYDPQNTSTGNYAKVTLPKGKYKLECYGSESYCGTKGGYSSGIYETKNALNLYLYCGGNRYNKDGYNGGGNSAGGATHIATKEGVLSDREDDYETTLLMVAGGAGADITSSKKGIGGGLYGEDGNGRGGSAGSGGVTIPASYKVAKGGNQEKGGSGGVSNASNNVKRGTDGSFGKGGSGEYGGGGGFYGGGAGGGSVSYAAPVNQGSSQYWISATAETFGAGGSGFINSNFVTDAKTEQGTHYDKGKIIITCLDVSYDFYTNTLHAPKQVMSGSTFSVHLESEFNSKYRKITEVKYLLKSGNTALLEKKATLENTKSDGDAVNEKYIKQLKMPNSNATEMTLEVVITYDDGVISRLTQIISVGSVKEQYSDEIRYVGRGFKLDGKSKWMTNKKLNEELNNSINKNEAEEVIYLR